MARRFLVVCLAFFAFTSLKAQNRTISGTVIDQTARTPLIRASVLLRSLTDSTSQRTLTDSTGGFTFTNLNRDSFLLTISFVGYSEVRRKISVDSSDLSLDIAAVTGSSAAECGRPSTFAEASCHASAKSPSTRLESAIPCRAAHFAQSPVSSGSAAAASSALRPVAIESW